MMQRHAFVAAVTAMLVAPVASGAEQAVRRVGFIAKAPRTPATEAFWDTPVAGLHDHGWIESRNIAIERRYVEPGRDSALAAAEDLVLRADQVIE